MEFANDGGSIGKGGKVTLVASLVELATAMPLPSSTELWQLRNGAQTAQRSDN